MTVGLINIELIGANHDISDRTRFPVPSKFLLGLSLSVAADATFSGTKLHKALCAILAAQLNRSKSILFCHLSAGGFFCPIQ